MSTCFFLEAAYVAAAHERELEQHEKHNAGVLDQVLANRASQDDFLHLMKELKMKPTLWGKRHAIARFRGQNAIEDAKTYVRRTVYIRLYCGLCGSYTCLRGVQSFRSLNLQMIGRP